jgi:hypothetical protein
MANVPISCVNFCRFFSKLFSCPSSNIAPAKTLRPQKNIFHFLPILFGFCSGFYSHLADRNTRYMRYHERCYMDRQRPDSNYEYLGPICKFGPGGEYISNWPAVPLYSVSTPQGNPLGRVLDGIARMIGLSPTQSLALQTRRAYDPQIQKLIQKRREKNERAARQDSPAYAAPITVVGDDSPFSCKPTLFSDDTGTGFAPQHKPHHGIRASRRPARKRFAVGLPKQGSLFETHLARAKTA